jgi:hypothetical protein
MIGAILLTINIGFFGILASYFFELKMFLEQRIAAALLIGLTGLSYISFVFANLWGLSGGTLASTLIVINCLGLIMWRKKFIGFLIADFKDFCNRYTLLSWRLFGIGLVGFMGIFGYLVAGLLTFKDGTYYVQPVHAYGDISLHLGIISSFVYGNNFPPQNPNFSGGAISYPFMIDYLTALFIQPMGLTYQNAFAFTGVIFFSLLIILLAFFVIDLSRSKKVALLTLLLFLFSGGFGFIYALDNFLTSGKNIFDFLLQLPQDYTAIKDIGYWWINVNLSMLLPQRSFLFGFGISLLVLSIFLNLKSQFHIKSYILGVILLALLPLIHAHSLIALAPFIIYFLLFIFKDQKTDRIVLFLIGLNGLIAAFLLSRQFLAQSTNLVSLFSWQIGWMSHDESLLRFYLKNFGLVLVVLPMAFYFLKKRSTLWQLGIVSLIWFVLPSVMIFQPWDFDNIKLFIYWYFFATILMADFFIRFFNQGIFKKLIVVFSVILIVMAGSLDVMRILTSAGTRYPIYEISAIRLSDFLRQNTPTNSVIVSADKFDNPAVSLAGRKVVMGFSPWLWTYGLNYSTRQQVLTNILAGQVNPQDIKKYHITHVIFFPNVSYTQNQQYFDEHYQLIYNQDGYRIYKL